MHASVWSLHWCNLQKKRSWGRERSTGHVRSVQAVKERVGMGLVCLEIEIQLEALPCLSGVWFLSRALHSPPCVTPNNRPCAFQQNNVTDPSNSPPSGAGISVTLAPLKDGSIINTRPLGNDPHTREAEGPWRHASQAFLSPAGRGLSFVEAAPTLPSTRSPMCLLTSIHLPTSLSIPPHTYPSSPLI